MKKKIVLMKNVKCNFNQVGIIESDADLEYYQKDDEKIILSDVVEIDFPELDKETVIKAQVAIIDKQITKVNADAQAALTALESRKQELLAISYESPRSKA